MPRPPHPDSGRLEAFALGKLADAEAVQVADHLAACEPCQQAVAAVPDDSVLALVRAAPSSSAFESGDASDSWVPPELIGHPRYRLLEWLGAGGMGVVFKAEHRLMQRSVAIKVISRKLTKNPVAVERFQREVKAAARLSHPNIVTAHDAERAGNLHCLVMEYVEGKNLARLVEEKGPLPLEEACDYTRQAALGLQYAHELGMVHRDIKPQNLMVTGKGQLKILDFGLAGFTGERDESQAAGYGSTIGTPNYMAPEQAQDAHSADIRADIYSLGCTLYFLLTGKSPFPNNSTNRKAAGKETPRLLAQLRPHLPVGLLQVLEKMLAREPGQRYSTPAAVAQALLPYAGGKHHDRRKVLFGLAGALVVALTVPVVYLAAAHGRKMPEEIDDQAEPINAGQKPIRNSIGMKLAYIPAGKFTMAYAGPLTPAEARGMPPLDGQRPEAHEVTIAEPFYLGVTEVTQKQYLEVMGSNPSKFSAENGGGPDFPVEQVTWDEAAEFCRKLSALPTEKQAGRSYRLPTEAEWEYAYRAGNTAPHYFDPRHVNDYAWTGANSGAMTHPVGKLKPNAWGLYDMNGNVWEWCSDSHAGEGHGLRGSSWFNSYDLLRTRSGPERRTFDFGFRVVCECR